jgi:hypothetical protein
LFRNDDEFVVKGIEKIILMHEQLSKGDRDVGSMLGCMTMVIH